MRNPLSRRIVTVAAVLSTVVMMAACACERDLIASGRVAAEPHFDQVLRKPPEVCEDKGDLVVSGRLENGHPHFLGGHIDVVVVAADGTIVYDAQVNYRTDTTSSHGTPGPRSGSFRDSRTRHGSHGVYSMRFPGLPPNGSVIRVRYDPRPHT